MVNVLMYRHPFNYSQTDGTDHDLNSASETPWNGQQPLAFEAYRCIPCKNGTAFNSQPVNCQYCGLPLLDKKVKDLVAHEACRLAFISLERKLKKLNLIDKFRAIRA